MSCLTPLKKDTVYRRLFAAEELRDHYRETLVEILTLLEATHDSDDTVYVSTLLQRLEHIVRKALE